MKSKNADNVCLRIFNITTFAEAALVWCWNHEVKLDSSCKNRKRGAKYGLTCKCCPLVMKQKGL